MSQFRATNIPEYNLSITCDDTNSLRLKANYEMSFARRLWNSSLIWSSSTRTKWPSIPKARVCNNFVSVLDITCKPVFTITIICLKSSSNHPLKKDKTANVDAFETIYGPLKLLNYWSHRHILFFKGSSFRAGSQFGGVNRFLINFYASFWKHPGGFGHWRSWLLTVQQEHLSHCSYWLQIGNETLGLFK